MRQYVSKDKAAVISVRSTNRSSIAWALHVNGAYVKSKVLPKANTAVVQNFGYDAVDFDYL